MFSPIKKYLLKIKALLEQETEDSKKMLYVYYLYLNKQATKEQLKEANEQFRDTVKGVSLGIYFILPFSMITLPFVVKLGQKLGINILPSYFSQFRDKK